VNASRARWVLDSVGAQDIAVEDAPAGLVEEGFGALARMEEREGPRDQHGRFPGAASSLDLLDPPLERLRRELGVEPPRWFGKRFAVALTHDVDVPWRWSGRQAVKGTLARIKAAAVARNGRGAGREARALAGLPLHRVGGTDPNWSFERVLAVERAHGARSTFFLLAGHNHPADGPSPETYDRLRPRLVEILRNGGAEIGLHGSYTAAEDAGRLREEKAALERLAGPLAGHRYHYLRGDPHRNLEPLAEAGFTYDSSLGFPDAVGFRAGIAQPFRPWDVANERPLGLVEIPLAFMDATFDERYLHLPAREAEAHLMGLVEWAAENGGGFAVLWHTDRYDRATAAGWDWLYERLLDEVPKHGGACVAAGDLAREADGGSSAPQYDQRP
jgi:peptidoglycan/xylan/chitin deacetylase (PgdA/CDA1 family)